MTDLIIEDVGGVTPDWVSAVLKGAGIDAAVRAATPEPVGTGQMGSCFRVRIDYERGVGPERLVVKLPATDPASREAGKLGYRCEARFYAEIAPKAQIRVPQCYFAASADDGTAFTLVLEDLAPAQQGDQIAGCTVDEARHAAVNAAGLHAPTWNDRSLAGLDWLIPSDAGAMDFAALLLKDATPPFVERYPLRDGTAAVLSEVAERLPAWAAGRPEPFSLLHSDYRLDNLLFAPPGAPAPVVAVDWQIVTLGLPLRDIAFLLATGLRTEDRRAAEREIVGDYHHALLGLGVEGYDEERCWEDYRYGLFQGPMITVLGAMVAQPSERGDRMFTVMAERSAAAIVDLDTLSLV